MTSISSFADMRRPGSRIPKLLAISSPRATPGTDWSRWCAALAMSGVDALQVRSKDLPDAQRLSLLTQAREHLGPSQLLFLSSRIDLALSGGADGVQLPASGLPVAALRSVVGKRLTIGRSTHSVDEVRTARDEGADFALFGPVFETPSKSGILEPRGLDRLLAAVAIGLPIVAIGGIDGAMAAQAFAAGVAGVAAIRWFENPQRIRHEIALYSPLPPDAAAQEDGH
ncbi:MAG: thiamine phosphate synthase [Thermoanaerobaculia bacterium]